MAESDGGIRLQAVITPGQQLDGTYHFEVNSNGDPIVLSGEINTGPGRETELAVVTLGPASSKSFTAQLKVKWQGGSSSCSRSASRSK